MTAMDDDVLIETCKLIQELGVRGAADHLGIAPRTVRDRRALATRRNLAGDYLGGPLPPGRVMGKVTVSYDRDGNVINEWQRQLPTEEELEELFQHYLAAFKQEVTPLPEIAPRDLRRETDRMTLYPVVDVHLGQHSWKAETGTNYNLKIATDQFKASVCQLMADTPSTDHALIVVLGDYFHANDNDAVTPAHKHHLDVDGRHDKVAHVGIALIVWMADMALQKHLHVTIHVQRGNHDVDSHRILKEALWWRYQNNQRVHVDISPAELWTTEFGINMLSFTHGDRLKAEAMPGAMAAQYSDIWGRTKARYGYSGHRHKNMKGPLADEKNGARWEILPAFTAPDAFNASIAGASQRELVSVTFDRHEGKKGSRSVII